MEENGGNLVVKPERFLFLFVVVIVCAFSGVELDAVAEKTID